MALRINLIGCGWVAAAMHGPAIAHYAGRHGMQIELVACCDIDGARAETFRSQFGFQRAYSDWQVMLEVESPDVVCLLVPPHLTCEIACAVLARGIPLLLEKPPGLTLAEYLAIGAAARQVGVPLRVAFNRRYMPLVRAFRAYLADSVQPGSLHYLRYDLTRVGRRDVDFSTTAIHGLDAVAFLSSESYRHAHFHYQSLAGPEPHAANIFVEAQLGDGIQARLEFLPLSGLSSERATLHFQDHTFFLELPQPGSLDRSGRLRHLERGRLVREWDGAELAPSGAEPWLVNGFYDEDASFFDDLLSGSDAGYQAEFGSIRQSVALMEAVRERRVDWSENDQ